MIPAHSAKLKFLCRSLATLLAWAVAVPVLANPFETQLGNGMKVIVKEDHRAPTAVQFVWYKVGSIDEQDGYSGLAHALEHMMFKGTPKVGPGQFSARVAALGGRENAFTSRDYTAYFQQVPADRLEAAMALESDRMTHLLLDPKEFAKEIQVVIEERRMRTEDQPQGLMAEALNSTAFRAHPYRRPVIGWMNDLENMKVEDLRAWYEHWYVPNNATLVVVGDVDHTKVFALAKKYYGALKPRALPVRKPQEEPLQQGMRRVVVKAPAELPTVLLAWHAPKIQDAAKDVDPYALEMLAELLSGYSGARLPQRLVRDQQVLTSASAGYDSTSRGPALFMVEGTPVPGKRVEDAEAALRAEIAHIATEGVNEEELRRARAQLVASEVFKLDSMFAQAMEIGQLEVIGLGYGSEKTLLERLQAVTAADVQRVAQTYFGNDTLTVTRLDPQPLPAGGPPKAAPAPHRH